MLFSYKAKTKDGVIFEEVLESADRFTLASEIRSRGQIPLSISEKKEGMVKLNKTFQTLFSKVSIQEQILFTKNLSGMLKAGLALYRAISVLEKQNKNPAMNKILLALGAEIDAGGTLSSGLEKFPKVFSNLFVSMVRAGEESGNLDKALTEVGENLEKSHSLTKRIKGALMYPSVIIVAMLFIGVLMFAFVVPTLAKTFKATGAKLPASTQFIISLGDFFSNHLGASLISIVAIIVGVVYLFKASFMQKYIDFVIIRLPVVGTMVKEINTARTARTMSSLLTSGVSITRVIEITKDVVQNVNYKKVLDRAKEFIERGSPLSEVFKSRPDLYPIMMSEMMQVGEETGKLSDMLLDIALFYEEEVDNKTKDLSTIIEPVLMVFIGVAVGIFAVSMLSPMYSVMEGIK